MQTNLEYQVKGLRVVAKTLASKAKVTGKSTITLQRGLVIVFKRDGEKRILSIGRIAPAAPSLIELEVVLQAFDAPLGAATACRSASNKLFTYNVIDAVWRELPTKLADQ